MSIPKDTGANAMTTPKKTNTKKRGSRELASAVARPRKRQAGRTAVESTPLAIRGLPSGDERFEREIRQRLARALGRFATLMERGTVRFEDVNGPRGGVDSECRVKLVLSGLSSVVASARADSPERAFAEVVPKVKAAAAGVVDKKGLTAPAATRKPRRPSKRSSARTPPATETDAGSLIGRRVGRAKANVDAALERPEKQRRDALVDTAAPGVSASDRRAGGNSTARRNAKKRTSRMTATLEDSRTTPSRKSTRASGNRSLSGNKLRQRATAETTSPSSRARRAQRTNPS